MLHLVAPCVALWIAFSHKRARRCSTVAPCTGGEATPTPFLLFVGAVETARQARRCGIGKCERAALAGGVGGKDGPDGWRAEVGGGFDDVKPARYAVDNKLKLFVRKNCEIGQARAGKVQNSDVGRRVVGLVVVDVKATQSDGCIADNGTRMKQP